MLRFLAVFIVYLGILCLAQAQVPMTGAGLGSPTVAASYTGPGDIVASATAWWSADACYSTATAQKIADVVDTATGLVGTRLQCASGGVVSSLVSGSACTFVSGNACSPLATTCASSCTVINLYDQSGAGSCSGPCDLTQATRANAPTLVSGVVGTASCMAFDSSAPQFLGTSGGGLSVTVNQPAFTISAVVERTTGFTNYGTWFVVGGSPFARFQGSTNTIQAGDGVSASITQSGIDGNPLVVQWVFDSTAFSGTSYGQVNSTLTSSLAFAGNAISSGTALDIGTGSGADLTGYICEEGLWPVAFTSGGGSQLDSMNTNMHTRNGF